MATGGVAVRPTRRLIGERGPEAVIPLWRLSEFAGGGGPSVSVGDVYVEAGGNLEAQAKMAAREVERRILRSGRTAAIVANAGRGRLR